MPDKPYSPAELKAMMARGLSPESENNPLSKLMREREERGEALIQPGGYKPGAPSPAADELDALLKRREALSKPPRYAPDIDQRKTRLKALASR